MQDHEPVVFTSGDSLWFHRHLPEMPAEQGWFLEYTLIQENGNVAVPVFRSVLNANNPNQASHEMQVTIFGEALSPGPYVFIGFATNGTYRHQIYRGEMAIIPDPTSGDALGDQRPYWYIVLQTLQATYLRMCSHAIVTSDVQRMRFEREKRADLEMRIRFAEEKCADWLAKQKIRNGMPDPSLIRASFNWPAC